MARSVSVISINGRRYDAASGFAIDGITRPTKRHAHTKKSTEKRATRQNSKPRAAHSVSSSASSMHKRRQKSQTLFRKVVLNPSSKIKSAGSNLAKSSTVNSARASRAKSVKKHPMIERFGLPKPPVSKALSGEVLSPPAKKTSTAKAQTRSMPATIANASHHRLERLLDEALLRADAHKQAQRKGRKGLFGLPRWLSILLVGLIVITLAAAIVWASVPAVAVKVAAVRSHINASLPSYAPSGFAFEGATSQPDKVNITYDDSASSKSYTLSEQKSALDSKSLSDNTLSGNQQVQTSQVNGTSVYIYGSSDNATWVNDGTLYTINNHAGLNSDQILQIVQSL